jgi:hypothetical protein
VEFSGKCSAAAKSHYRSPVHELPSMPTQPKDPSSWT